MRLGRPIISSLMLLVFLPSVAASSGSQAGRESLFILGVGARALGMGGAYSAVADDASAVFWNAAGLALLEHRQVSLMHVTLYEETSYDFAAAAWPIIDIGTIGIGGIRLGSKDIEFRDKYGPLGMHDYSTGQYTVSYGARVYRSLRGGLSLKLIDESLGDLSSTTAGLDAGVLLGIGRMLSVGLNLQDILSGGLKLSRVEEEVPYNVKCGAAARWLNAAGSFGLTLAGDIDKTEDQPVKFHAGCEAMLATHIFARAGYDRENIAFGGGVRYRFAAVDYAYRANETLGGTHRIGLTLFFGPTIAGQREQREEKARAEEFSRRNAARLDRADELWELASGAFQRNELDSAMVLCSQAIGYNSEHGEAQKLLAEIRRLLDLRTEEEIDVRSRERAREDMIELRMTAGTELIEQGKLDEARLELSEVLKLDPENSEALNALARIDSEVDKLVEAHRADGEAKFERKDYGEAIVAWNKALELRPNLADVRRRISEAKDLMALNQKVRDAVEAYSAGDTASARRIFNEVLDFDADNPTAVEYIEIMNRKDVPVVPLDQLKNDEEYWAKYLEGLTLFRNKQYEEAIEIWQVVLEKYPGSAETKANIEQARLRLQQ